MNLCLALLAAVTTATLLLTANSLGEDGRTNDEGNGIAGRVVDMTAYTNSSGYRFLVALRGLRYQGQADRTLLESKEDGSLTVWMSFRNIRLTIGQISLSGEPGSATCGPMLLNIGHRREIWVALDFDHHADADRSLTLSGSRCRIENDNWAIGSPAWVRTSGWFMSENKVVSGVRNGLAGRRERIEQELKRIAYSLLGESCSDSGEAPANQTAFEQAVEARLVQDGYLTSTQTASGSVTWPLVGFAQNRSTTLIRQD
jgi:hypothetical protein